MFMHQVFLTHFYGDNAAFVLRSDYHLYQVFAYLVIFRYVGRADAEGAGRSVQGVAL